MEREQFEVGPWGVREVIFFGPNLHMIVPLMNH